MKRFPSILVCIILLSFSSTFADSEKLYFNIPSQEAKTALEEFVELTNTSMVSTAENLDTLKTKSVTGTYTLEEALDIMLQGSGLEYTKIGDTTFSIKKRQTKEIYPTQIKEDHPVSLEMNHDSGAAKASLATDSPSDVKGQISAQSKDKSREVFTLEDIVVTANRVESLASKTPVAVTAVTGETITREGILDPTMLEYEVPNLSIVRGVNGLQITIRGVTSTDKTEKGDPAAAFMVDSICFGRTMLHAINFYDIDRVEVLRGPQGTLYGRNTTAGVVNVITNKPKDMFESAFNVTAGNYSTYLGDGMVNVAVSDALALRAAFSYRRRDNYINMPNATYSHDPSHNDLSFRLQALFDINENASLLVKADFFSMRGSNYFDNRSETVDFQRLFSYDPQHPEATHYVGGLSNEEILTDLSTSDKPSDSEMDVLGISAELNWNFGPVAFTYLGSYHDISSDSVGGYNSTEPAALVTGTGDYWQSQQEIRLATTGDGPFNGQMGVYYFKEESGIAMYFIDWMGFDKFGFPQDPTINESYAVFGQGTYSLTPDLRLTAGIRYTHDFKSRKGFTHMVFHDSPELKLVNNAEKTFTKTNYRVGLDYDLKDNTLLYGSIATGYKAGGFNDGCESSTPGCNQARDGWLYYDPENVTAYEIGTKTRFSDKMVLNGAAFYYDYEDLQLSAVVDIAGGGSNQVTTNAAKAEVKGVEIESVFMPNVRHRINATLAWLDAAYKDYVASNSDGSLIVDYAGRPLDRSPEFTANLGYRYRYPLPNGGDIEAALQFRWGDSYMISNVSVPVQFEQPSYHKTDLSVTYTSPEGAWYFQVFGKNLEDELTLFDISAFGVPNVTPNDPCTYGVRAGFRF
jgi:iron complex outermembrane receptor protein